MNSQSTLLLLVASLLAGGCSTAEKPSSPNPNPEQAPAAAKTPTTPPVEAHQGAPPITLKVEGPAHPAPGEIATLAVTLTRNRANAIAAASPDPITLAIDLPSGVTLIEGSKDETITSPDAIIRRTLRVKIEGNAVPLSDVDAVATIRGEHYGAQAKSFYRFGRGEPMLPTTPASPVRLAGGSAR